ncbi:MAG TPA: hemerythrin domain-containing protein [Holophagaceae bacterium]|nr:hemerythrin domain-containing protein [Holophagaceae bacterium]
MASLIEDLRDQHRNLVVRADALRIYLAHGAAEADPAAAHRALVHFGLLLRTHLDLEDGQFYPKVRNHAECSVLVAQFEEGMSRLQSTADAYLLGWPDARSIANNPGGFRDYTGAILRVLERRIQAEEEELFPRLSGEGG